MKRASILGAVLAALWCAGRLRSADQPGARAWQDTLQLPTYDEGSADPNPEFAAFASGVANYPYALRRNFTNKRSTQTWRTLNLENEYLFCRVMPDLGGHVYNCRDKRSGREVFYANPVVKKADVGLRGAWVAMGIEPNFPIGHARDSVSGVDSAVRANPDGSATVVVEQIERVTGMQWRVEYTLRPGSAALESHVVLYNRSLARRPYSWWANAGVALDDPAERFILPSRLFSVHGAGEIESWPVASNGRNESLIAGHKDGVGWFAYGSQEPFFAVYKPASRSGVAHFADA